MNAARSDYVTHEQCAESRKTSQGLSRLAISILTLLFGAVFGAITVGQVNIAKLQAETELRADNQRVIQQKLDVLMERTAQMQALLKGRKP